MHRALSTARIDYNQDLVIYFIHLMTGPEGNRQRNRKQVSALQCPNNSGVTQNPAEITNIFNHYFLSIGPRLAYNLSPPRKNFQDYLAGTNHYKSFFFDPVSLSKVDLEILATPSNKVLAYILARFIF